MKTLILILFSLNLQAQNYLYSPKLNLRDYVHTATKPNQLVAFGVSALNGAFWAHREIDRSYPGLLQDVYNQKDHSFIGRKSWERNYDDWNVANKHKFELFNSFRDLPHFTGFSCTIFTNISDGLTWNSNVPKKYKIINAIACGVIRSTVANLTFNYYANKRTN
jgi:hypothetical protein